MNDALDSDVGHGTEVARVTPPMDASVTVSVGPYPVSTLDVPADTDLRVYMAGDDDAMDSDYGPENSDAKTVLGEPHETITASAPSWVAILVGGERRLRFTVRTGETINLYVE